jgi:aspartate/methionine/tyrosine aminotransferase
MSDELWRLFTDGAVPLELLKQRAHNQRWAEQPQQVIPLTAADPDFPAAAAIREVMVDYARSGVFSYGPPAGLSGFRQAVARRLQVQGAQVTPEGVIAVNSAAAGLAMVCRHWLRPGDEAIVADPVDYLFAHTVRGAGGVPVLWPLGRHAPLDLQSLQALVSPRTRLLCLCNPHNPLGRCFRRDELEQLGRFSRERGIRVLSDEVWSDVVYPPVTFTSWLALPPDLAAIGAVVYGFSKGFGLAGLRIGYVAMADPDAAAALLASSDQPSTVEGVATISQVAAEAACGAEAQAWLAAFLEHLRARRDSASTPRMPLMCSSPAFPRDDKAPRTRTRTRTRTQNMTMSKDWRRRNDGWRHWWSGCGCAMGWRWSPAAAAGSAPRPWAMCASASPPPRGCWQRG